MPGRYRCGFFTQAMRPDFVGSLRRLLPPLYLMGDDLTLAMFTWSSGHPKVECEVQLYAMVGCGSFRCNVVQCVGCTV